MKNIERVRNVIAEALYLDVEQVTPEASLMKDLGAESIDFLDIMFRLEKEFSIKMPKGEIERRARGGLTDAEFAVDGQLTDKAIASLKAAMPEVNQDALKSGLHVRDIPSLFTVATFSKMVDQQLFGSADAAASAASAPEKTVGSQM